MTTRLSLRVPLLAVVMLTACNAAPAPDAVQLEPTRTRQPEATAAAPPSTARSRFTAVATPRDRGMDLPACSEMSSDFAPSPLAASSETGRVLFLDNGGDVMVANVDGEQPRALTSDAFIERAAGRLRTYRFPAPSPDGASVAFVRVDVDGPLVQQTVQVANVQGGEVRDIDMVQGVNVPYVDWSADGGMLAYLAIAGSDAVIRVAPLDGGAVRDVQRGAPAYWNWSPDTRTMMTHVGGRARDVEDAAAVSQVQFGDDEPLAEALAVLPGQFQAPQYSPDGRHTMYAVNTGPSDLLVVGDAQGQPKCSLTRLDVGAFFSWSPDGVHVAMIDVVSPAAQTAPVRVFDIRDGSSRTVHRDALMFFWSPSGDRLAVVSAVEGDATSKLSAPAAQTESAPQLLMRVEVVDISGERTQRVADLHPTAALVQYVQYFDQYSRAMTMWSPDGRRLAFAGALEANGPGAVVVAEFDASGELAQVRRIADGVMAMFIRR